MTIVRIFVVYKPFKFFMSIAVILFSLGFLLGLRFLYYYFTGDGNGHMQSVVLAGVLMGMGGVRGMLVTLGMLGGEAIDISMILAFIAGVTVVFSAFGLVILYINNRFLSNKATVRKVFATAGLFSVGIGVNMLLF